MGIQQPDLMTLAKQLSSGYMPISASVIRGDIYEAMVEPSAKEGVFGHGYTYSGHPVACAVALKTLEIYQRDGLFGRAAEIGTYMQHRLRELRNHPLVGEVRGEGMLAAVEMVSNKATLLAFLQLSGRVRSFGSIAVQYKFGTHRHLYQSPRILLGFFRLESHILTVRVTHNPLVAGSSPVGPTNSL